MENTLKELAKELNDLLDDTQITLDNIDDIARIINALQC